jgi:DNA-binding SARP family transcriptional activator
VQVSRLGRLAVLDETEAVDLLRVLAEARTGRPPVPPREQPRTAGGVIELARPAAAQATQEAQRTQDDAPNPSNDAEQPAPAEAIAPAVEAARVRIRLLGAVEIDGMRAPAEDRWRPQCLEVLAYLAVCGGSATRDALLEDLLPDKAFAAAPQHLYNYVSLLRKVLNLTGGDATYLTSVKKRYTLTRDLLDVDVWRMADALTAANDATSDRDRETALRAAVGAYNGPFAADQPYEWAEPYRAEIDRKYLNAITMLAELLVDEEPAGALRLLETAIGHHRHAEPLYALAMHAHSALGRHASVTAVKNDLVAALAELDSEPEPQTLALYQRLTARTGRRPNTP